MPLGIEECAQLMCLFLSRVPYHICIYFWHKWMLVPFLAYVTWFLIMLIFLHVFYSTLRIPGLGIAPSFFIHFCIVPLPSASESPWTEFDKSPIAVCHLSEDLFVIVKECFPALILMLFPSANWADLDSYIFLIRMSLVNGEVLLKSFYLLTFAWIRLWFCVFQTCYEHFL